MEVCKERNTIASSTASVTHIRSLLPYKSERLSKSAFYVFVLTDPDATASIKISN